MWNDNEIKVNGQSKIEHAFGTRWQVGSIMKLVVDFETNHVTFILEDDPDWRSFKYAFRPESFPCRALVYCYHTDNCVSIVNE